MGTVPPVAVVVYVDNEVVTDALYCYFVKDLGILVSFISDRPRPFMHLYRLVSELSRWLRRVHVWRFGFLIDLDDRRYRALAEHWGAAPMAQVGRQMAYMYDLGSPRARG